MFHFCLAPLASWKQLCSFDFALLFGYWHMNCCTTELKIQSFKHIQEDFTFFWLSISLGNKSFQLHRKEKKKKAHYNPRRSESELKNKTAQVIQDKHGSADCALPICSTTCHCRSSEPSILLCLSNRMESDQTGTEN